MLLKKLHRNLESKEGEAIQEVAQEDEKQLEERLQKMLRKQKKSSRIRKVLLIVFIGIGLIGGYKALGTKEAQVNVSTAVNDYSFTADYLTNYFTYPQKDTTTDFLQQFTTGNWSSEYESNIKSAEVTDAQVYQSVPSLDNPGFMKMYARIDVHIIRNDDKEDRIQLYTEVEVISKNGKYVVDAPVAMIRTSAAAMSDADKKDVTTDFSKVEGKSCNEEQKKEISNTIQLFLSTYSTDLTQAQLLMEHASALKPLDPNTKITFVGLGAAGMNNDVTQAVANVVYETGDDTGSVLKQNRNIRFTFDRKTSRITNMEVY